MSLKSSNKPPEAHILTEQDPLHYQIPEEPTVSPAIVIGILVFALVAITAVALFRNIAI